MRDYRKTFWLIITAIAIAGVTSVAALIPGRRQNITALPEATSHALEVVSTERVEDRVKIALKNVSNKTINGYQLSVSGSRVQIEFLDADDPDQQALAPGEVYEDWFKLKSASADLEVIILAVVFEDGESEGDKR